MLNWLIVGIGDIARRRVIPALQEEERSSLYGVVSRDREKGRQYTQRVWTDLHQALRDPGVDAVYIATPVALHGPQTIAALRAGKHVLCEKPMAMTHPEALSMLQAAEEARKTLSVAYYRRYYPKAQRARDLMKAGAIGRPVLAEINCHGWFNAEDGQRTWLLRPEWAGGGPLFDIASHRIDLLNFLFGEPVRVSAHLSDLVHGNAVEDSATVMIEYANGVRGVVDVRWHTRQDRDQFRVIGTEGEIQMDPLNGPAIRFPRGEETLPCHSNVHFPLVRNFVESVLDGGPLLSSGASAAWTDWVTERALGHNRAGRDPS
jgi:1,5-anhydro-D-fructose reductase (1,5-anhydro-D-mannitol-forming)